MTSLKRPLVNEERYPESNLSVDEIMRAWPATVSVMIRHRMLCIGCPVGKFHTVRDACQAHGIDELAFIEELKEAISGNL